MIPADWTSRFPTPMGWAGAAGRGASLVRVLLPEPGGKRALERRLSRDFPGAVNGKAPSARITREILALLEGRGTGPGTELSVLCAFDREVLSWIRRIPRGSVAAYGTVADWMGRPGAARAVGGASGRNPFPLVVPCHRVVGCDGSLVGFSASGGTDLKRKWLEWEGVEFRPGRRPRVAEKYILKARPRP